MPLIDNECFLLDREEFDQLHQFYDEGEDTIAIGNLADEPAQEIKVAINKLFASHIGIFGNTGSGKSNTLAKFTLNFSKDGKETTFRKNQNLWSSILMENMGWMVMGLFLKQEGIPFEHQ